MSLIFALLGFALVTACAGTSVPAAVRSNAKAIFQDPIRLAQRLRVAIQPPDAAVTALHTNPQPAFQDGREPFGLAGVPVALGVADPYAR